MNLELDRGTKTRTVEGGQTRVNCFLKVVVQQENMGDPATVKFDSGLPHPFQLVWNLWQLAVEIRVCALAAKQFDKRMTLNGSQRLRELPQIPG